MTFRLKSIYIRQVANNMENQKRKTNKKQYDNKSNTFNTSFAQLEPPQGTAAEPYSFDGGNLDTGTEYLESGSGSWEHYMNGRDNLFDNQQSRQQDLQRNSTPTISIEDRSDVGIGVPSVRSSVQLSFRPYSAPTFTDKYSDKSSKNLNLNVKLRCSLPNRLTKSHEHLPSVEFSLQVKSGIDRSKSSDNINLTADFSIEGLNNNTSIATSSSNINQSSLCEENNFACNSENTSDNIRYILPSNVSGINNNSQNDVDCDSMDSDRDICKTPIQCTDRQPKYQFFG